MYQGVIKAIGENNQAAMKELAKVIAVFGRSEIEEFHVELIPDKHMPELNRLIRNGIYKALFAMANYETDIMSHNAIHYAERLKADFWEEPELSVEMMATLARLSDIKIMFQSDFLNKQYGLGNIFSVPNTRNIRIKNSFEFNDVDYNDGKKTPE